MSRGPLAALALAACALRPYEFTASATDTTGGGSTIGLEPTTASAATTTTGATTTGAVTGGQTFLAGSDHGPPIPECDQWLEDCPEGQKCMPYDGDGTGTWNHHKCVPIDPDPDGVGEPCTAAGFGLDGEDSCGPNMICWGLDPDTGTGTCVAMCEGSPEKVYCADPKSTCVGCGGDCTLPLCLLTCDPLAQDCPGEDRCLPNAQDPSEFICIFDASDVGSQTFAPCKYFDDCDAGLMCAAPSLAVECDPMAAGCCLPFCDLSAPICPGEGQQCLPWYEPGMAPSGLENVGLCGLPP